MCLCACVCVDWLLIKLRPCVCMCICECVRVMMICHLTTGSKTLTEIEIGDNKFGDNAISLMCRGLQHLCKLTKLHIRGVGLTTNGNYYCSTSSIHACIVEQNPRLSIYYIRLYDVKKGNPHFEFYHFVKMRLLV